MNDKLEQFYLSKTEPNRSCLLALRDIILNTHDQLSETRKYGMPCFVYGKKHFCYLWTDKKTTEPYILMVDGNQLNHPALETGSRARMRILRINPLQDLDLETINAVLKEGIELYKK
ncbi:MAG: DUF1801 domain-containing protein [Crocinitomicaceae bacterium]